MVYVLIFNTSLLIFRILYILYYHTDLSPEEAQYWDWSRHLDLSYYSKPPMVAYLNFLAGKILGVSELAVRVSPVVLSFLLSIITYVFVRRIFGHKIAFISSTLPQITVGYAVNSLLMTTDAPFVFFWSLSVMCLYEAMEKNDTKLWFLSGVLSGFAFLSKYPAVFLLPITLTYMALLKRHLLKRLNPYFSLIPAFLLSLPVFVWNYMHNFVSFKHVSTLASKSDNFFQPFYVLEFVGSQAVLLSVLPFITLLYAWVKSFKNRNLLFFTFYSLPIFLFFLLLSFHKRVEANWSGFAYFSGFILISYFLSRSVLLLPTYFFSFLIFLFLHFTPLLDALGFGKFLPPEKDPTKFLVGWRSLAKRVDELYTGNELVFSPQYQVSAELAFYMKGTPQTYCVNLGRRMNQYDLWKDGMKAYIGKDAIFVSVGPIQKRVLDAFDGIIKEDIYRVFWRGKEVSVFYIYKLKNYRGLEENLPMGY
ncbi:MAG: glycosyltransferase family 39 protein [Hydrogenobacter sp.]